MNVILANSHKEAYCYAITHNYRLTSRGYTKNNKEFHIITRPQHMRGMNIEEAVILDNVNEELRQELKRWKR